MHHMRGYTLPEALTVLLIMSILYSIAITSYQKNRQQIEASSVVSNLTRLLNSSRNHALIHHKALTICGSDGTTCNNNWTRGVLLFSDVNRNGIIDRNDTILNYLPLNIQTASLSWRGFGGNRIIVESMGTSFASNGSFIYCPNNHDPLYIRQVVINRGGRVRTSRDTNHDGIHEDAYGINLSCH